MRNPPSPKNEVLLHAVSLPPWQSVVLPRLRDGVDEDPELDIDHQLETLAERYDALDEWMDCIVELRGKIDVGGRDA
jgi:hypothetical protein